MRELYEKYVGKEAHIKVDGLLIKVMILDIKKSYGRTRYLVTPRAGSGEVWREDVVAI